MSPAFNKNDIFVVGVSHKTVSIEKREAFARLARDSDSLSNLIQELKSSCNLKELVVISTCNRFELVAVGDCEALKVIRLLQAKAEILLPAESFYFYKNKKAVSHVFKVIASLDSLVIGESQILNQVKKAYRCAVERGLVGKILHRLFQHAFFLTKKVKSETSLNDGAISVSYIAVKLAGQIFSNLSKCKVLVIGSGEIAELSALNLKAKGCENISITNRTLSNVKTLANSLGASLVELDKLGDIIYEFDIVISSVSVEKPLLSSQFFKTSKVKNKSLFIIDLGLPRNFSNLISENEGIYHYTLDDFTKIAKENEALRSEAVSDAELIVEYASIQYMNWLESLTDEPFIVNLRTRVAEICKLELVSKKVNNVELEKVSDSLSSKISDYVQSVLSVRGKNEEFELSLKKK